VTWGKLVREAVGAADKRVRVQLARGGDPLAARVVRIDATTGLALLQAEVPDGVVLASCELGGDTMASGEPLVALACPDGKDLFAFAGVASAALHGVALDGCGFAAGEVFLTDARADLRCDGAAVFDGHARLCGVYSAEHVRRDIGEPTLDDLRRPSFGVVLPGGVVRRAFAAEFATAAARNESLRAARSLPAVGPNAAAVARIAPSVVSVWAGDGAWPELDGDDPGAVRRRAGLGSGVVVARRGLVVTNAHLVQGAAAVRVRGGDKTMPAKVLKTHLGSNLALLLVDVPGQAALPAAACSPDDDVILGETVLAVGSPLGTGVVVTAGVVSADRRGNRLQADPNLGNQNAGGAIVDASGRLLGIGDGGLHDPLEVAYAQRGDEMTAETNLSTFVRVAQVRSLFAAELAQHAGGDESIRNAKPANAAERAARENALTAMVARTAKAMLNIEVSYTTAQVDDESNPFASVATKAKTGVVGLGSGVVIDRSGLAISNWHVVDAATWPDGAMRKDFVVHASVFGGRKREVRVLSISREHDLSLLQLVLEPGEELTAVEMGSSAALQVGEGAVAIGNPHGRANTITAGIVSAKDQGIRVKGRWAKLKNLVETDAAINPGNSGGALLDLAGRLIGINSAGGGKFTNVGYAIAVDHVRQQLLSLLLAAYKLRSPDLGIQVIDQDGKVLVATVDPRGPAARADLRTGDRIGALGGTPITWSPGFAMELRRCNASAPVRIDIDRGGARVAIDVAPMPANVWAVIRQTGIECRRTAFHASPDIAAAVTELQRQFTGDRDAVVPVMPEAVVRVERVHAGGQPEGVDLRAGDLILAAELVDRDTQARVLVRFEDPGDLQRLFNERLLGDYEGAEFTCWIARGAQARQVEITAKRLFW
jgi:S1-C subfamily serine protease